MSASGSCGGYTGQFRERGKPCIEERFLFGSPVGLVGTKDSAGVAELVWRFGSNRLGGSVNFRADHSTVGMLPSKERVHGVEGDGDGLLGVDYHGIASDGRRRGKPAPSQCRRESAGGEREAEEK